MDDGAIGGAIGGIMLVLLTGNLLAAMSGSIVGAIGFVAALIGAAVLLSEEW